MASELTINVLQREESLVEVLVKVSSGGFCGWAQDWVNTHTLREFGTVISHAFPLEKSQTYELNLAPRGSKGDSELVSDSAARLVFYPGNSLGLIACHVTLRSDFQETVNADKCNSVSIEIYLSYEMLGRFGRSLVAIASDHPELREDCASID